MHIARVDFGLIGLCAPHDIESVSYYLLGDYTAAQFTVCSRLRLQLVGSVLVRLSMFTIHACATRSMPCVRSTIMSLLFLTFQQVHCLGELQAAFEPYLPTDQCDSEYVYDRAHFRRGDDTSCLPCLVKKYSPGARGCEMQ